MRFGIFVKFLSDGICSDPDSLGEEIQAKLGGFFAFGSKKTNYERRGMTPKGSIASVVGSRKAAVLACFNLSWLLKGERTDDGEPPQWLRR